MCALSFERCIGYQCDLNPNRVYELRLKQFIDVNKHRFYVVDKNHTIDGVSVGFNIMEIDVLND